MNPKPLLDLIARYESESAIDSQGVDSGYDVVVSQAFKIYPPIKPITSMTITEVLLWQSEAIKHYRRHFRAEQGYSAAGRYQIVRSTLRGLANSYWKVTDLFDAKTQDLLAFMLLRRRGWDEWCAGRMNNDLFADSLSQEWASLPFNTGYSYYAGDRHGNHALVSRKEVLQVLNHIREQKESI